jgi:hypothetical protein
VSAHEDALPISENLRLGKEGLDRLVAVVLDANAYGNARPNLASLTALAQRLHSVNIQTWVPEPVAWEWAQHLSEDWVAVKNAATHEQRQLRLAGLQPPVLMAGYADEDAVIQGFLDTLAAIDHVEIITLTGPSAAAGLRDQVLQRGPASRKKGVKSGASDSAWLRDVIARAGATTEPLLFITEDDDIVWACTRWGYTTPVTRKLSQVRATVFEVELDTGVAAWLVLRYLARRMPVDLRNQSTSGAADALLVGATPGLIHALDPDPVDSHKVTDATLTRLTAGRHRLAYRGTARQRPNRHASNRRGNRNRSPARSWRRCTSSRTRKPP